MQRLRRTKILIESGLAVCQKLSQQILQKYEVTVIVPPHNGLVMVKVRDQAEGKLFYLGEVLVTECRVQIGTTLGIGLVQDHQPKVAYHLAVIDAAYQAELPEVEEWEGQLAAAEDDLARIQAGEALTLERTKVHFSMMNIEGAH
ncbi:MAG: phosphonate C-P lyase system protein PhnG [Peptococcaceae bacterium]|nr:phosphonate C-P lyase system protein PhnG [Peptococcaceae bacterium]MBT9135636.1 hypothetical protein [Bacillota bacterium]MBT9157607.1 hypothetical protein [Bacillota bacterium]